MRKKTKGRKIVFMMILAVFLLAGQGLFAKDSVSDKKIEIMPVSEVKEGMKGYGLTVYQGVEPERFEVEILGVFAMPGTTTTDSPIIIAKLSGGPKDFPAEKTGVVAGMSGSPVYVDGKLIGAIAYLMAVFSKDAIAGIRPAKLMINPYNKVKKALNKSKNTINNLIPIPLVLSVPDNLADVFKNDKRTNKEDFTKDNFVIFPTMTALNSVSNTITNNPTFGPGSAINIYLVKGDITVASSGTVTMVDGDTIYAFGHPFFGLGEVDFYFHQGKVTTTMSSYYFSSKLTGGDAGGVEGTITDDYYSAIKGKIDQESTMFPVKIDIEGKIGGREINFEIVKLPRFTDMLIDNILFSSVYYDGYREVANLPAGTKQKMVIEANVKFNDFKDVEYKESYDFEFYGTYNQEDLLPNLDQYCINFRSMLSVFEQKGLLDKIKKIDIKVSFSETGKGSSSDTVSIEKIEKESYFVTQGEIVLLGLVLSDNNDTNKKEYNMPLPVAVPENALVGGDIRITVGNGKFFSNKEDIKNLTQKETIEYFDKILENGNLFLKVEIEIETKSKKVTKKAKEAKSQFNIKSFDPGLWQTNIKTIVKKKVFYKIPLPHGVSNVKGVQVAHLTVKKKPKPVKVKKENGDKDKNEKDKKDDEEVDKKKTLLKLFLSFFSK